LCAASSGGTAVRKQVVRPERQVELIDVDMKYANPARAVKPTNRLRLLI